MQLRNLWQTGAVHSRGPARYRAPLNLWNSLLFCFEFIRPSQQSTATPYNLPRLCAYSFAVSRREVLALTADPRLSLLRKGHKGPEKHAARNQKK